MNEDVKLFQSTRLKPKKNIKRLVKKTLHKQRLTPHILVNKVECINRVFWGKEKQI